MRRSIILVLAAALVGTTTYAYKSDQRVRDWSDGLWARFAGGPAAKPKRAGNRGVAPVRVAVAGKRDVPITLEGIGNVQARSTVAVKSRIDGQVMEAAIKEGQLVAKGDLLFRLDARPLQAQLQQAQANVARSRANYEKARSDSERYGGLAQKGYSPKSKLEEAQTSVAALQAEIRAAEAAVEIAKLNLAYATIQAPIDGRIGQILLTPGNMVKANDTQAMLMITSVRPINVAFALPEQYIAELRRRMQGSQPLTVSVSSQGRDSTPETGTLTFINNVVDAATGSIQVMAVFANEREQLVPGQFVKARVTMETLKDQTVVPAKAVQLNQKGQYVWVLKGDDTVEARPVGLGPEVADLVVISRGVAPGETVVTDGQLRLFPGAKVAPIRPRTGKDQS
ncbi:MAG: efflux RND transporter periplasmic adaptor subunit [Hyphomicrobiaceae bacterium]